MKIVIAPVDVDGVSRHASLTSLLLFSFFLFFFFLFFFFPRFIYKDSASKTEFHRFVRSSASLGTECLRALDGSIYPAIKKRRLSRQFVHHFCFVVTFHSVLSSALSSLLQALVVYFHAFNPVSFTAYFYLFFHLTMSLTVVYESFSIFHSVVFPSDQLTHSMLIRVKLLILAGDY